jgi:murein DD-endopeptidase MepM/ murein hydrolase activator NlpD
VKSPLEGVLENALDKPSATPTPDNSDSATPRVRIHPSHLQSGPVAASDLPVNGIISSPEGWRRDPINGEARYHAGTDIAAPAGTPIRAVAGGRVIESGVKSGYGNTVVIQTDDGRKMLYAHNNQNFVRVGDQVAQGEEIAEVGSTGRSTGPHVHFEVKF